MPSSLRTREQAPRAGRPPEEVTIRDWGLRDRPLGSSVAVTLAAGLAWLAGWATGHLAFTVIVGLLLAITLWRTLLPIRYELTASGIGRSVLGWRQRSIPWSALRRFEEQSDGVVLVTEEGVAATPLGGLYLHWGDQRDAVLAQLDHYFMAESRTDSRNSAGNFSSVRS